ncbi:hypothetical protein IL54_3993 [Sphingobium sp. ba1]|nr:hypothetical protein IL54_3993 [Sphingobium sp. ba1]
MLVRYRIAAGLPSIIALIQRKLNRSAT